ncbi:MAG: SdpI family protein [Stellaceae bacterium]
MLLRTLFFGLPALTLVLGIPLSLKLVPPNRFYGYRTASSFASPEAWYQINFATGLALIAAGILSGVCALMLSQGLIALKPEPRFIVGVAVTGIVTLLCLIPVVIYSNRF